MLTDYKRFISYMYVYKSGEKGQNIGYAKIEAKNNKCKFIINVKSKILADKKWNIHLIYRKDKKSNDINLIDIEHTEIKKDEFNGIFVTYVDNLFESKKGLNDIAGILIICDKDNYIGTEWDDKEIKYSEIERIFNIKEEISESKKGVVNDNVKEVVEKNIGKEIEKNIILEESKKEKSITVTNKDKDHEKIINREIETKERIKKEDSVQENINKREIESVKPFVKRIFSGFPGMYPFEDDEIIDCVKLEPHDLGVFPMDKWQLANNSFLLHGYYTYRHLIFARMRKDNKFKYILGVPGIFRDRERFMAQMFGFNNFKGVRNKSLDVGEFGYWYMYFNL